MTTTERVTVGVSMKDEGQGLRVRESTNWELMATDTVTARVMLWVWV